MKATGGEENERGRLNAAHFRPADLEIVHFEGAGVAFAVLAFRIPRLALPALLSPAEQDVARLLCDGFSPATIARRRQRSRFTIVNQVRSIYTKLGVTSHAELLHALTIG
jgi:DNA-binding CsgD family transcriptional regulator